MRVRIESIKWNTKKHLPNTFHAEMVKSDKPFDETKISDVKKLSLGIIEDMENRYGFKVKDYQLFVDVSFNHPNDKKIRNGVQYEIDE